VVRCRLLRRPLTRVSSLWECQRQPYHEWKRRRAVAAAHGRCATEGNTRTLLCRIGFLRGSCKPAAGLSGHLPVSQLEYTATQASGLQHLRATYEKYLPDGRSKMKGVAQQRIDSLHLSSAQESPIRDFGELIAYARRTRRKATAGTVAFSFWH